MTTFVITVSVIAVVFIAIGVALDRMTPRESARCCEHQCTSDRRPQIPGQTTRGD